MTHQYVALPARPRTSATPNLLWLGMIIGLERLSYYGTRSVLATFLVEQLQVPRTRVGPLLTTLDALLCLLPLVGAFIADRYWGLARARLAGGVVLLLGQLVLVGASLSSALAWELVCVGLVLQVLGNALLAPALYTTVGQLFARDARNQLTGFVLLTAFVMAGAFMASTMVLPLASGFGYPTGLGMTAASAAAVLMLLALLPKAGAVETEESALANRPWLGPAAGLTALAAGSAWWLLRAEPAWALQVLSAGLAAVALGYCSFRAGLGALGLLVALMLLDVLAVALMVLMPNLTYDGVQMSSALSVGLMVVAPLIGLLLAWLWVSRQPASAPGMLRRLVVACVAALGASAALWAAALALNTTPTAVSSSANSWALALAGMALLYPANNVLNVLLPTLTAQRAPVRYLALLMAAGFNMSRLGGVLGEVLLDWWQGS
ncbi:hypothetical protein LJ737_24200 [Hymenobacter sp. 15J16-1T3B]|uniref:hypothetical protein n=1 Tax=Hymenobacter sp. 15J16-1T3B TaxID=2886941 RepID=UPI001D0FF408|nr:hypothetical protein [Hymenobacter sp. 15J16-1T3B]MCC3160360.1 hypothetical protein [Hymenobacter sp. 15J16-1T3B]